MASKLCPNGNSPVPIDYLYRGGHFGGQRRPLWKRALAAVLASMVVAVACAVALAKSVWEAMRDAAVS